MTENGKDGGLSALGCGAGAVLLFDVVLFGAPAPSQMGAAAVWLADRDGQRVVVLDRELFVLNSIAVRAPIAVAPVDGGAWVLSVPARHARGSRRLEFIAADGARTEVSELDASFGTLAALGAECAVVGADDGRVRWITASTRHEVRELQLAGSIHDLAPATRDGAVWILWSAATTELACVDAAGERVAGPFDVGSARSVAASDAGGVRTYELSRARQLDGRGRVVSTGALAYLPAVVEAAAGARGGEWFVATAGGVVALDARGRIAAGQGGFDYLVDIAVR